MSTRNACKTCALGMGGQQGAMTDEAGRFPEVCKKSIQAMAADMRGRIAPEFFSTYSLAELRNFSPRELEAMGRLVQPVYAGPGDTHYRAIEWHEAIERCVAALKATSPDENFFYVSGRSSNEAGFLLQLFARLHGTNNVNNCSYYCHQASGVGLSGALGTGTATVMLEDLERCDLFVLIGGNPASNHPRLMRALMKLRRRGGEVIVVNPLRETGLVNFSVPSDLRSLLFGSPIASLYVQPHIGGDIALLTGVAKRLTELGKLDLGFIDRHTEDWPALREHLHAAAWADLVEQSGVDRATIERFADLYASAERTIFGWTMGITHHAHGVDNVRAIVNLALMRGMVGRPGAGLLPIRGHSNVQGIGSMGVTPKLRQAVFDRLEQRFGVKLPTSKGMDTLSCMEAMSRGELRAGWCLGGNLFGANPDAKWASEAIGRLDSIVYLSTSLNTGHAWGRAKHTLILPVLARDEEPQATTQESMFNYVRLSEGGPRRYEGPRSEVEIVAQIARGVLGDGGPIDWAGLQEHRNVRRMIGAVVPGYERIAAIDDAGREFQVAGRTFHIPRFNTPTGRAKFHVVHSPSPPGGGPTKTGGPPRSERREADQVGGGVRGEGFSPSPSHGEGRLPSPRGRGAGGEGPSDEGLLLMTIRSEGQFNTVVYEDEDIYRGQDRRDVILMSAADIARLGLTVDQRVTVRSAAGEFHGAIVREAPIRPGNAAMYYPEANVLVAAVADPESRTPAFKSVPIEVVAESAAGYVQLTAPQARRLPHAPKKPLHAC